MPAISVKVNSVPRFNLPRFLPAEMKEVGTATRAAEVKRIKRAEKPDGSPARPLAVTLRNGRKSGYAIQKQRKVGRNKRDWTYTGEMLNALAVATRRVGGVSAAIIKFPSSVFKKAIIREKSDELFSLSRDGEKAGSETAAKYFARAVERTKRAAERSGR